MLIIDRRAVVTCNNPLLGNYLFNDWIKGENKNWLDQKYLGWMSGVG